MGADKQKQRATPAQVVRADAAQRAQRAWAARVSGSTWAEAAGIAGYSDAAVACRAVKRYFGTLPRIESEDMRDLWRERLETLWAFAHRDARKGRPGALRAGVAVAQRAAALDGLDAPTRYDVATDAQLDHLLAQLFARAGVVDVLEAEVLDLDVVDAEVEESGGEEISAS